MVSSAVVQEAVNQVLYCIKDRYERNLDARELMERMEMAHIKLEATLQTSEKWNITSTPLLRWQKKLKRVAEECDDTLHRCKRRIEEEEQVARSASFCTRIAHATRSLAASIFNTRCNNELSRSTVCRFEWFAEGAGQFLRNIESGGTPHQHIFLDPLVRHLLAGKGTKYCIIRGSQHLMFLIRPFSHPEHGIQGRVKFLLEDNISLENNFQLDLHFRLSENTDIVGIIVRCMQLFTPHLRSTAEIVQTKLTHLPMQDFFWEHNYYICRQKEHWDRLQTVLYNWFRPSPLCCQQHNQHYTTNSSSSLPESFQCDKYLEPVTVVYLQGYVALSVVHDRQTTAVGHGICPTKDCPFLKFEGIFSPHASFKRDDLSPTVEGSTIETINRDTTQHSLYANISFEQLGKIMLPKAIDCLRGNVAGSSYQMLWKSKHGGAYVRIEETSQRAINQINRGRKRHKWQGKKVKGRTRGIGGFVGSWAAHAPVQLRGSFADWVQKQTQMPPCWDTCVH